MEINSTYEQVSNLITTGNYSYFGQISELQYLASENNIIFTVIDKSGKNYNAEIYYNSTTNEISSPIIPISPTTPQISYLLNTPVEILHDIIVKMNLNDILNLCQTSKKLNTRICDNDNFWQKKYINDFGTEYLNGSEIVDLRGWKDRYRYYRRIWSFGNNFSGELGLGDSGKETDRNIPTMISMEGELRAKAISAGYMHSLLLDINDKVYSFGYNNKGQLGLGDYENRNEPTLITTIHTPIKAISSGHVYSLLLDIKGRVWSFGNNDHGQLGLGFGGPLTDRNIPTLITDIPILIKAISAGISHSLLLDIKGRVWSFGNNEHGQLGLGFGGPLTNRNKPAIIVNIPIQIKAISTGINHSLLLDIDGRVWSFGDNRYGQLGLGDSGDGTERVIPILINDITVPIKTISTHGSFSLLLDINGKVYSFGKTPVMITKISINGKILNMRPELKFKDISAGRFYSLLLDINGRVWSLGDNTSGQLGLSDDGYYTKRLYPTQITHFSSYKRRIEEGLKIKSISAGYNHSLIISY